ncbi:ATP-dependent nuclease [Dyadobacter aurulentus]|uniref:ATP-dependent nuclease n=1 Tax=Dyadobacter sp. UC 10 TaxID=2605428 RepID=UPI0011F24602|nr:AAA family ATPase [Dyadobacter sp. UC 10]KAA0990901.1 AAA family ATPase [Dyadobacter sp. UC 10]
MYISSLSIRNFRSFKSARFLFTSGINTVIGENGSGKSNLFHAIRLLLDESLPRNLRLSQGDFNRSLRNRWEGHWIVISIEFEDLDPSDEAQALAIQIAGRVDAEKKGSYALYFRPKYQVRKQLFDFSQTPGKNAGDLQSLLDQITIKDYETVFLCRGGGDFSDEATYLQYVGDFNRMTFPDPDMKEELVYGSWIPKELSIYNEVSCTFIKALRDVEADLKSYNNNPLVNLLRGREKTVEVKKQQDIIGSINDLNNQISELDEVQDVKKGIDRSIKEAAGTTYAPNINIKSELPNEMERLFQSLKLWVGDPDEAGYEGRIWELSLGGANLIYLSLKLFEYEKVKTDKIANLLLIEEPEAHIHTHIQKTLFDNLRETKTQVIISTHSTHVSSVSKISSVNILSRGNQHANVFQPANNLVPDDINRIERYLDAVRSNLLFAKGVILVEGDAEQILIPELFKKVMGLSLDEIGVSLVNIGSTGFSNIATLFHQDRIGKFCAIITDGDKSVVELPEDPEDDDEYQAHCRASQASGQKRQADLDLFCEESDYLNAYYADYTFEIDLLLSDNSYEFGKCLKKIYSRNADIEKSKEKLKDDNVNVSGVEALRLAEKVGKGWFALLLAEEVFCRTFLPDYILKAIAFASSHINHASKVKAIKYRLECMQKYKMKYTEQAKTFLVEGKSDVELIEDYRTTFEDDQLTKFLECL